MKTKKDEASMEFYAIKNGEIFKKFPSYSAASKWKSGSSESGVSLRSKKDWEQNESVKKLIESNKSSEEIIDEISDSSNRMDSKYFIRNTDHILSSLSSSEQNFVKELIDDVQRYHPDGDISLLDLSRLADGNSYKNQVDVDDLLSYIWYGMV